MSWQRFAAAVAEAKDLSREEGPDYGALAAANHALAPPGRAVVPGHLHLPGHRSASSLLARSKPCGSSMPGRGGRWPRTSRSASSAAAGGRPCCETVPSVCPFYIVTPIRRRNPLPSPPCTTIIIPQRH